jgi:hypothetical protein
VRRWLRSFFVADGGFAMMTVVMGMAAMVFLVVLIYQDASREYSQAQYQRRDDSVIVGAEAMLERYASKLTVDPRYYQNFVDEAEMPRRCTDSSSPNMGLIVLPGNPWYQECSEWEYEDGTAFAHPLLEGDTLRTSDDVTSLMAVVPPGPSDGGIQLTVVTNLQEFGQTRALTATIKPESISEFAFLVDQDLRFGSGAVIRGKIYVGGDLNFRLSPVQGIVHRDVYAEEWIGNQSGYGPPIFSSGSQGFSGSGSYTDIRTVYEEPLDFVDFWDDLDLIRQVACGGGGLCLSDSQNPSLGLSSNPTAWLLEPHVAGAASRITVKAAYSNSSYSCVTSEEWWWLNSQNATWTTVGTFDVPDNGAVWVDGHAVVGLPGTASVIDESFTIYAGSAGSRKNIIIGSDINYLNGTTGTTVLGMIASDEVWVNPSSVGGDNSLTFNAAIMAQGGSFQVPRSCGDSDGGILLPYSGGVPISTLNTNGSMAFLHTGDVAAHFGTRNYGFDSRLETLRPPLFPLLGDAWSYVEWREQPLPCWAIPGNCP